MTTPDPPDPDLQGGGALERYIYMCKVCIYTFSHTQRSGIRDQGIRFSAETLANTGLAGLIPSLILT